MNPQLTSFARTAAVASPTSLRVVALNAPLVAPLVATLAAASREPA